MTTLIAKSARSEKVQTLMAQLEQNFYTPLEQLCHCIRDCITKMHGGDSEQTASLFTSLSRKLVDHVATYVALSRLFLATSADDNRMHKRHSICRSAHIAETKRKMEALLAQLSLIAEPAPTMAANGGLSALLYRKVNRLRAQLTETFAWEESSLQQSNL